MDHGPRIMTSMVHNLPNILNLDIEVIEFYDPSTHLQHENFCITWGMFWGQIMTPQPIYSIQIFVSLLRDFDRF